MRINTNLNAMIATNQMSKNTALAGSSMEKLSTGLRITKAGDDAAGLAVSEKMRAQIRGMEQAERNVQDGISMVQTAEGALEEAGNIAQRMRELGVQAGNDTLSAEDRTKVKEELKDIVTIQIVSFPQEGMYAYKNGVELVEEGLKMGADCVGAIPHFEYAKEFGVKHVYGSVDEMLADENIDIVYIATPHNSHYEFLMKALQSGKHVFCEKAITVNDTQLEEAVKLAAEKKLVICDGMTLYHMPIFKKLKEIVDSGKLGPVKMIQVNFGSCKEYDVTNRFFSKELAGGALLDIGVYATSFARFFMKSKPDTILTTANYFETGVDETSGIILRNPDGQMAVMALTMRAKQPKRGVVACEDGFIEIYNYPRGDKATITYTSDGHTETIEAGETAYALDYEVEDMQNYVLNGGSEEYLTYSRDVMSVLTDIRKQWGMIYPFE